MQGQAAEVLGLLGSLGKDNAVPAVLQKMVDDVALPLSQRATAAKSLGQLNYSGATIAVGPYLQSLGNLAGDVLNAEKQGTANRRRLKSHLLGILAGIKGADAQRPGIKELAKTPADQARVEKLRKPLETLSDSLDDPKISEDSVANNVETAMSALEGVVKKRTK
jgi:hypothetical protein